MTEQSGTARSAAQRADPDTPSDTPRDAPSDTPSNSASNTPSNPPDLEPRDRQPGRDEHSEPPADDEDADIDTLLDQPDGIDEPSESDAVDEYAEADRVAGTAAYNVDIADRVTEIHTDAHPIADVVQRGESLEPAPGVAPAAQSGADDAPSRPASAVPGIDHVSGVFFAAVVGGGLVACAALSALALLVGIAVVQALLAVAWVFGTGLPGRIGALILAAFAAAAADTVVSVWPHGQLGTLAAVFGLAIPAMFVHQLTRGVVRTRVVESLSDIALLVISIVALAAFIQLRHEVDGRAMTTAVLLAAAVALVAGHLVDLLRAAPRFDVQVSRGLIAVLASIVAGAAVGYVRLHGSVEFNSGRATFLGAAVGAGVALFAVGTGFIEYTASSPSSAWTRRLRPAFGATIAIALVAPVAYVLCLAIRA